MSPRMTAIAIGAAALLVVVSSLWIKKPGTPSSPVRPEPARTIGESVDASALRSRISRLETRVVELQARKAELTEVKADLDRQFKEKGVPAKYVETPEAAQRRWERGSFTGVDDVAAFLGLDTARRDALVAACADARSRAKQLEAARAVVTVDGEVTTIRIPAFPDEGKALAGELLRQVEAILTPQEKEKYLGAQLESTARFVAALNPEQKEQYRRGRLCLVPLFGEGMSYPPPTEWDRRITIVQSGDKISINAVTLDPAGKERGKSTSNRSKGVGADPLAPYRHLLK
jgi:hypothetical protein